ncbi:uncharacterized protein LOC141599654 [Silene latifolia]|uniref:uncharacterized protein LOC141599654 n=1 Tax=Silene latifolia TaxID=37657 RepID=UPI003D7796BC
MEEKFPLELEPTCIEEEEEDARADHEFYETIEAPKFVDFTRPNHFCPDDRYWFCSRLGCNQKHEEEMDSEAIYKDFVLRVMAARSPNVRFRRALTRKPPSDSKKCPMSAPPKPSKSRIPRLALVSSISKKLIDDIEKNKTRPATIKPAITPKARVKHVSAKYMTSPRKKNAGSPKLKAFQSVKNPKKSSITLQKNRVVAKALLFSSPKKGVKAKTLESGTPVTKLCEGIKKLAINSEKKGNAEKSYKASTSVRKFLPSNTPSKLPGVASSKAKTLKTVVEHDKKHDDSAFNEARSGEDSSDMEIEDKSGIEEKSDKRPLIAGNRDGTSSGILTTELSCVPDSEDQSSKKQNATAFQELNPTAQSKGNKSYTTEDDIENKDPGVVVGNREGNDDKENALITNDDRNVNENNLNKDGVPIKSKVKKIQKLQTGDKTLGDNCPAVITQGVKYKKLKPTNPKPFRLRTDERGILKEATLERKVNSHENSTTTSENSQNTENGVATAKEKAGKKVEDRTLKKVQFIPIKSKYKKTSKEGEPLSRGTVPSENATKRVKSSFLRPLRETTCQVKPRGLIETEESSKTMSAPKESRSRREPKEVATHKLASLRRKQATVPREPKFHTLNAHKSCTRNIQQ